MDVAITKEYVKSLKDGEARGQSNISLDDLKKVYKYIKSKDALAIYLSPRYYVMFKDLPGIEFSLNDCNKLDQLDFIIGLELINASKGEISYHKFIGNEFLQGAGINKLGRLATTFLPLAALNFASFRYATDADLGNTFSGLLAAMSIFVAIFSLFTISQDYLQRKQQSLFSSGKLAFYFSIDKHMVTTGLITIFFCILGILIDPSGDKKLNYKLAFNNTHNIVSIVSLNFAFIGVLIVLRSIREFYIGRPGAFIMGDLKNQTFNEKYK